MFRIKYSMTEGMLRKQPNRTAALMRPHSTSPAAMRRYGSASNLTSPMMAGAGMHQRYSPVWERAEDPTLAEDFLPSDAQTQHKIFRNLLMFDAIAGPAIEYWRDMAFGNSLQLSGLPGNPDVLKFYQDAIDACGIVTQMPMLLSDYLSFGKFVFHMYMDESKGYWTETIPHDLDYVSIKVSPFPSMDPLIDLQPNQEHRDWATSSDPRVQQQRSLMDPVLIKLMAAGQPIPLAPENTMFLARRVHSTDYYGTSFLTRIMPFKIYEKALLDASIAGARRRAGPLWHITVWPDATDDEMGEVLDLFFAAEEDPIGGKVITREGVVVTPVGGGAADFWKLSDEWAFLSEAKMRALGISEQFLSGEANYNSMEMVLSTFLEKVRSVRAYFTKKIIIDKICSQLAKQHGFVQRSKAELSHRIRTGKKSRILNASEPELLLPTVEWDKPLTPIADQEYLSILDSLEEKGFPIPIRMRAQIAGFDIDKALESFKSDVETRKQIYEQKLRIKKLEENFGVSAGDTGGGGGGGDLEIPGLGGGGPELEGGGAEPGGGSLEMPELGGEIGGGEEAGAPAAGAEAGGAAPAAGPGGAGASGKARFSITPPAGQIVMAAAREQRVGNVMRELEALPLWDREGYAFGLSRRRAAKILDRIQHSDPDARQRSELSRTLIASLQRTEGLDRPQSYLVHYAAIRLHLLPPAELASEAFELVNRYFLDKMAKTGLDKSLTREITFLSRISEACGRKVGFDHREVNITSAMLRQDRSTPDNLMLTGAADVSPGPNVKIR
jgi:hypothetical protein